MTNTRRDFIKKATILSSVAAFSPHCFLAATQSPKEKLGIALVGLGYYSTDLLAPALQLTSHCELRGIVTGTPSKVGVWQQKYGIKDKNIAIIIKFRYIDNIWF